MAKELSTEEWKGIILDLKRSGIRNMHLTGGEPLLREDITGIVFYGSNNGFTVGLTTNGMLATREILEKLVASGLRSIAVSMDAIGEKYDAIRGLPGSFMKLRENLAALSEVRKRRKIDAYINFTLMKATIGELKGVKRFADELGLPLAINIIDKGSFLFDLEENGRDLWVKSDKDFGSLREALDFLRDERSRRPRSLIINFPAIDFIEDYFKDPRQHRVPCVSSQDRVIIDPYGNLMGGCMSMGTFGNLKERPFGELRKAQRYMKAKRGMFYKDCAGCSCGYLFNTRMFLPLILKDAIKRIDLSFQNK